VLDASTDPEYAMPDYQHVANNRTMLGVPLLRKGVALGSITLWKTSEGTGLGLSICHDIIVKQHSGSIEVVSQPGEFTEIRIILPRKAAFMV
jgi:hypothetical protein